MRVLLAVGEPNMSSILRGHLVESDFDVIDQEVLHRKYLQEIMGYEKPSIIIIHDHYLESDLEDPRERDQEMLRIIDQWRLQYESSLRVVYLCERNKTDPLLGALVARNVLDIFCQRVIPSQIFINQLSEPPKFANVSRIGITDLDLTNLGFDEEKKETTETTSSNSVEQNEKQIKTSLPSKIGLQIHVHKPPKVERVGFAVDRKIIVVVSPFERSGATFIAHQIAYQITKRKIGVTYFENPFRRPYTFDRFSGHLHVPEYRSLYAGELTDSIDSNVERKWIVEGVSVQVLNPIYEMPYVEEDISIEQFLRIFLASGDTPFLLVDLGADRHRAIYDQLLSVATHIVVVMDCDIPNLEWFDQNKISPDFNWISRALEDERSLLIANRFVKAAGEALPNNDYLSVPSFKNEWIYKSQIEGTFTWGGREAINIQETVFGGIVNELFPQFYSKQKKKVLKDWLPKFKMVQSKS